MFETGKEKAEQAGIGEDVRIIWIKGGESNGIFGTGVRLGRSVVKSNA